MKLSELQKEYGDITLSDNVIKSIRKDLNNIPCPSWITNRNNYYYIYSYGGVDRECYDGGNADEGRLATGNFFETREEAEFEVERRKVEAKLLSLGGTRGNVHPIKSMNYELIYRNGKLDIGMVYGKFLHQGNIYFRDRNILKNVIKIIGEKRIKKYLFYIDGEDKGDN